MWLTDGCPVATVATWGGTVEAEGMTSESDPRWRGRKRTSGSVPVIQVGQVERTHYHKPKARLLRCLQDLLQTLVPGSRL